MVAALKPGLSQFRSFNPPLHPSHFFPDATNGTPDQTEEASPAPLTMVLSHEGFSAAGSGLLFVPKEAMPAIKVAAAAASELTVAHLICKRMDFVRNRLQFLGELPRGLSSLSAIKQFFPRCERLHAMIFPDIRGVFSQLIERGGKHLPVSQQPDEPPVKTIPAAA